MKKINNFKAVFTDIIFYISILFFIIGFSFMDSPPPSGWYQQFMPDLGGAFITDITFTDSLTGYAVTSLRNTNDSSFILKTTNSGDNWSVIYSHTKAFVKVKFINSSTGFTNAFTKIFKTTDGGNSWSIINLPSIFGDDMFVLNQDTIWLAMSESLTGGVYRTTNGGASWDRQINLGNSNPTNIYFFNSRIGFIGVRTTTPYTRKTTDGGLSWSLINSDGFYDMYFIDSLKGWKAGNSGVMKKTTDGGLNWVNQQLPVTLASGIIKFTNVNKDTIWGTGGIVSFPNNQMRGILYRTTNGGNNWLYQIPDTTINVFEYSYIKFINKNNGWVSSTQKLIHTTTGGNDTFLYS